jgi:DNA-binding transcriptional MerR regulator
MPIELHPIKLNQETEKKSLCMACGRTEEEHYESPEDLVGHEFTKYPGSLVLNEQKEENLAQEHPDALIKEDETCIQQEIMTPQLPIKPRLYSRSEISHLLNIDHSVLSRWEKRGWITSSTRVGNQCLYTEEQFQHIKQLRTSREQPNQSDQPLCTSCNRRRARVGSTLCSRCSFTEMERSLRDTLPGMESEKDGHETSVTVSNVSTTSSEQQEEVEEFCPKCGSDDYAEKGTILTGDPDFPMPVECDHEWHKQEYPHYNTLEYQSIAPGTKTYSRRDLSDMFNVSPSTISRWERKGKIPQPVRIVHSNQYIYTEVHVDAIKSYISLVDQCSRNPSSPLSQAGRSVSRKSFSKMAERAVASRVGFRRGNLLP